MTDHPRNPASSSDTGDYPGTPRWVKVIGIVVLVLVLVVVVIKATGIGGEHGPGRHLPSEGAAGHPPPAVGGQQP